MGETRGSRPHLGAHGGAVEDGLAAVQLERVVHRLQPLSRRVITGVDDPPVKGIYGGQIYYIYMVVGAAGRGSRCAGDSNMVKHRPTKAPGTTPA